MGLLRIIKSLIARKLDIFRYLPELFSRCGHIYVYYAIHPGHTHNINWGDDINKDLIELISKKRVIPYHCSWIPQKNYLCIGSILQWNSNRNAIVWGAGLREPKMVKKCKKILAVRGPLTREHLVQQGFDCPEIYGDPALLFPMYYLPTTHKKHSIGIICHFSELNKPFLKELRKNEDIHIIDIKNYGKWQHFIDEVVSCDVILSSSLHGCIVSDAYRVPNLWCRFSEYIAEGNGFKFIDYYRSVGKDITSPYTFVNNEDIKETVKSRWKENKIDLNKLLDVCPFKSI